MSAGLELRGARINADGPINTGISLVDCEGLTVSDCVVFGSTFPHSTLEWLTQHPSLRRRSRVAALRRKHGWKDAA